MLPMPAEKPVAPPFPVAAYSPATTLVGTLRGIDPSRNFEILHLSISGRPFTAQGTPAP
jgi:hypothetical protein